VGHCEPRRVDQRAVGGDGALPLGAGLRAFRPRRARRAGRSDLVPVDRILARLALGALIHDPQGALARVARLGVAPVDHAVGRNRGLHGGRDPEGGSDDGECEHDLAASAVERDVQSIFQKLRLPESEDANRRVLAVLALLGR